ncbi:MAG: translation elongation factor 4, partial [Limisphaerales bacterium]
LEAREMKEQVLDNMDLERERGITIKAHAVKMHYPAKDGQTYILNLIDTPGHVDFTYEVSRSLASCEGAILVVDASQGIEAQTLSNLFLALDNNLTILPVVNKIDLPGAQVEDTVHQLSELLGIEKSEVLLASAKMGSGIEEILEALVERVPPPKEADDSPLRALIFDSVFDSYRGALAYVRIFEGKVKKGDWIKFFSHEQTYEVDEVGYLKLKMFPTETISSGEVGYIIANVKRVADTRVGDTITLAHNPAAEPLPGFKHVKPMVFAGLYPSNSENYEELRDAMEKLVLNDSALVYEPESSNALGFGFRCGFLGLLHLEIMQERLSREYNLSIISTVPNVEYRVVKPDRQVVLVDNPAFLPPPGEIDHIEEPFVLAHIITPSEFIGNVMKLCMDRRGVYRT